MTHYPVVNTLQLPSGSSPSSQELPPPQDVQPSLPAPLPAPIPPIPLPPPKDLLKPPSQAPTLQPLPGKVPETLTVNRFEVFGSTVFSPKELVKVLAPFTQKQITFTQLFQARSAITQLYIDNGYITSGAYIPPQRLQGGVVRTQVVEGRLEDINITGTRRLSPNYIRSRIAVNTLQPLNQEQLLEALQLLQLNPLIENLSAELSAGSRLGASVLDIQVTEAKSDSIQVVLDNGRSQARW